MPGKPYHHGDLARELVSATRSILEAEGVEAVTMTRLARECGVSVAAPYRHFASKEALLLAVISQGYAEFSEVLVAATTAQTDQRTRLVEAGVAYVEFGIGHPHLMRLMLSSEWDDWEDADLEFARSTFGILGAAVQQANLRVPVDVAMRTAWSVVHGMVVLRLTGMEPFVQGDSSDRIRTDLSAVLDGILAA